MSAQLTQSEQRGVPVAVIVGESELAAGVIKLRNVATKEEEAVPRGRLVEAVRRAVAEAEKRA